MPRMDKEHQQQTAAAERGDGFFAPVPAGIYHLRLRSVDGDRQGGAGPYWSWEFEILESIDFDAVNPETTERVTQNTRNRRVWNNTSLAENAAWKMQETFDAFEAEYGADTDDLCGKIVRGEISQQTQQQGKRRGHLVNQIDRLIPNDGYEDGGEPVGAAAGKQFNPEDDIL